MGSDPTELLFEIISESGAEYTPPKDLITVDELVTEIYEVVDPVTSNKKHKYVPYEDDISNYDIPDDISPEEMRQIIIQCKKNAHRRQHSEQTREKISISMTGNKHTAATKKKISKVHKGKPKTEEHKKKISETMKKVRRTPVSEETREKIRQALIKKWAERKKSISPEE